MPVGLAPRKINFIRIFLSFKNMTVRERVEAFSAQCSNILKRANKIDLPTGGQVTKVLESGIFSQQKVHVGVASVGQEGCTVGTRGNPVVGVGRNHPSRGRLGGRVHGSEYRFSRVIRLLDEGGHTSGRNQYHSYH